MSSMVLKRANINVPLIILTVWCSDHPYPLTHKSKPFSPVTETMRGLLTFKWCCTHCTVTNIKAKLWSPSGEDHQSGSLSVQVQHTIVQKDFHYSQYLPNAFPKNGWYAMVLNFFCSSQHITKRRSERIAPMAESDWSGFFPDMVPWYLFETNCFSLFHRQVREHNNVNN